ncbi:MAG TPA: EamA family transporter [Lachnospiraceae bacterium]|nr:EamA family transporter [Lachnospiraceae bacterium]
MGADKKKTVAAASGLLLVAVIWGAAFAVVKNSLDYIPPVWMLALRFLIAGGIMTAVLNKRLIGSVKRDPSLLKHGIIVGILLYAAYLAQTIGCVYTTAGKNAFLTAAYVVIVPFVHWIRTGLRPDKLCFIAALIAITGIGLISLNGDMSVNKGDVLTLICGFLFALQIEYLGKYSATDDSALLTALIMDTAAVCSWVSAPLIDGAIGRIVLNRESVTGLLYLAFLSTMVCFLLQSVCQKYIPSAPAAIIMSSEAVFGALSSALFLKERMSARVIAGCFVLFGAIILAQLEPCPKRAGKGAEDA